MKSLKKTRKEALENISKAVIETTSENLVKVIKDNQDAMEKRNKIQTNSLHEQLKMLSNLLLTPAVIPDVHQQQPQAPLNQCNECGITFGTSRALSNHVRKDHKPKS